MKLTFLGTRGCIEEHSTRHARHSALLVENGGQSVLIDCGEDWLGELDALKPKAVLITHAHPDHADGLRNGAPCPVWATAETWDRLEHFPVAERRILRSRQPSDIGGISFEAFPVQHSLRAPAVGLRIAVGHGAVFYVPDVADLPGRAGALRGVRLYIGDGACVRQSLLRIEEGQTCGHAPVETQLDWCAEAGVPRMIVTHCGGEIVGGEEEDVLEELRGIARRRGIALEVAYDGMVVMVG